MVAIVTGAGLGLQRDSASALGTQGQLGTAVLGQAADQVTVNAANGNLVIQSQDEMLIGLGLDDVVTNTYNSQGTFTSNGWQESFQRHVGSLSGTVNTAGSTITHYAADGSAIVYTYNGGVYVGNEMGGAYDTLSFNGSSNQWTWQDGKTRATEVYDNANSGRLVLSTDASGNALSYSYSGSLLTKITTASGDYTSFTYTGALLTSVVTSYTNASGLQTATRVRYGYDASNRLTTVTTDLSPNDNSVSDGNTYVTTYGYDGTSDRVNSITQSDGTNLALTYTQVNGAYAVASYSRTTASGVVETTSFTYGTNRTTITNPQGNATTLVYDAKGELTQLISPPTTAGGALQIQAFSYDANGNVTYSGPAGDPNFTNIAQNWGDTWSSSAAATIQTTETDGGVSVYRRQTTSTAASGWAMNLGQASNFTPVSAGQSVWASAYAASSGASSLMIVVDWYNASGGYISSTWAGPIAPGGVLGSSGLTNAHQGSGFVTAPAGASFMGLTVQGVADGSGPMSIAIAQPKLALVVSAADANFTNIQQDWNDLWTSNGSGSTTQTTEIDGGVSAYRRQTNFTPASGWAMNLGQGSNFTPVGAGQSVWASAYAASSGASSLMIVVNWYSASGGYISSTWAGPIAPGGVLGASGLANAHQGSGFVTAPAGAAFMGLTVQGVADGSGPMSIAIAQPKLALVVSAPDANFTNIAQNWGNTWTSDNSMSITQTTELEGGIPVYRRQTTSTPPTGWGMNMGEVAASATAVVPGQTLQLSAYVASSGASSVGLWVEWYGGNGQYINSVSLGGITPGGTLGSGGVASANFGSGSIVVPVGAAYATLVVQAFSNGSSPLNVAIAKPVVAVAGTVTDPNFTNIPQNWNNLWDMGSVANSYATETDGGVGVFRRQTQSTPPSGWTMNMGQSPATSQPVVPGQTLRVSAYAASSGASSLGLWVCWYDANGSFISGSWVGGIATGGTLGSSGVATANYGSGTATAPAGAVSAGLTIQAIANGTGPLNVAFALPAIAVVGAVTDANFTNIPQNWNNLWDMGGVANSYATETDGGGISVFRRQTSSTPPSGWTMNMGQSPKQGLPVVPGQAVQASAYAASSGASSLSLWVCWYDANGNFINGSWVGGITPGGTLGASGLAGAYQGKGGVIAPAGAAYAGLTVQGVANGSGPLNVAFTQPTLQVVGYSPSASIPTYNYTYDGNGNRLSMTDALGNATTYSYNSSNHLLTRTEGATTASPQTTRYVYDSLSRLVYMVSPRGDVTRYMYNAQGEQLSAIKYTGALYTASGTPTQPGLDAWSSGSNIDVTQIERTDTTYDARGQVASVTTYAQVDGNGNGVGSTKSVAYYTYDQAGNLLSRQLSSSGQVESYVYDGLGRVTSTTDFNGKTTSTSYSNISSGLQTTVTMANGTVRTSTYDKAGELVSSTTSGGGLSATTTYAYDADGNLIRTTDPTGLSSYFVYNAQGEKVADVAADGTITAYSYNAAGQVVSTVEYANKLTAAQLSQLANENATSAPVGLANVTPPASGSDRWSFNVHDAAGRLVETIDPIGAVTAYSYDGDNRLVSTTAYAALLPAATLAAFQTVAPAGLVLPPANATNDRTTRTFYNVDDQVTGTLDADGYLTQIVYDDAGRKVQTIAYATQTNPADWASGSFSQLLSDAGSSTNDIYHWWIYDGQGQLRADIDGVGNITRYDNYTAAGDVGTVTTGQTVNVASLISNQNSGTNPVFGYLPTLMASATGTPDVTSYTYDQYGHVLTKTLTLTGGATETTSYGYDAVYNLVSQTTNSSSSAFGSADGRTDLIRYDAFGRKSVELSGDGAAALAALGSNPTQAQINAVWGAYQTVYTYDASGRLVSTTDANNHSTLYYYDIDGRLTYGVDATGHVVQYGYDTFGRKSDVIAYATAINVSGLSGGQVTSALTSAIVSSGNDSHSHIDHNADGTVGDTIDALGAVTSYLYDAFGDVTGEVDPLVSGATTTTNRTYSRRGLLLSSTANVGGLGLTTSYQYDAFGRATQVGDPLGNTTRTTYDRAGEMLSRVDALSQTTTYTYDGLGHVLTVTDPTGARTTYAYSLFDRQVTVTDPNGIAATTTTNAYGQTVRVVDGTGAATNYTYDADGNLVSTADADGRVTNDAYDKADQLTSVTDANGVITSYSYDAAGRTLSRRVDPTGLNLTTSWTYDGKGEAVSVTNPAGTVTAYTYDLDGRKLSQRVDPNGLNLTTSWTYDQGGRLLTQTDPAGHVTQNVYDTADRLAFTIDPAGAVTGYTYDNDGDLIQTVHYAALLMTVQIQSQAQMQNWAASNAGTNDLTTQAAYDADGRLIYSVDGDGYVTAFTYDADGRVTSTMRYPTPYGSPAYMVVRNVYQSALGRQPEASGWSGWADQIRNGTMTNGQFAQDIINGTEFQSDLANFSDAATGNQKIVDYLYHAAFNHAPDANGPGYVAALNNGTMTVAQVALALAQTPEMQTRALSLLAAQYQAQLPTVASPPAGGQVTRTTYDAGGRVVFTIDPNGAVTGYTYDHDGRVIQTVQYAALDTAIGVQSFSSMQAWVSANAGTNDRTTQAAYDAAGQLIYSVDGDGYVTAYTYDADGRVTSTMRYPTPYGGPAYMVVRNVYQSALGRQPEASGWSGWADQIRNGTMTNGQFAQDIINGTEFQSDLANFSDAATGNQKIVDYLYHAAFNHAPDANGPGYVAALNNGTMTVAQVALALAQTPEMQARALSLLAAQYQAQLPTLSSPPAGAQVTRTTYDEAGRVAFTIDPNGAVTAYTHDGDGRVVSTVQYAALDTATGLQSQAQMQAWVSANAGTYNYRTTQAAYDNAGRLVASLDVDGYVTGYVYDGDGRVAQETRYPAGVAFNAIPGTPPPGSQVTHYAYDNVGNLVTVTDPLGIVTYNTYDTFGRQISSVVAAGTSDAVLTQRIYDADGRVLSQTVAAGTSAASTSSFTYDAMGNKLTATDGNGHVTHYSYDSDGRVLTMTDPAGGVTTNQYDAFGDLVAVTDPNGHTGYFYYDGLGRQILQVDAQGYATATSYDLNGQVLSLRRYFIPVSVGGVSATPPAPTASASDDVTSFTRDNDGRVLTSTDGNGYVTSYSYDAFGDKLSMTNALGGITTWTYDGRGQVLSQTVQASNVMYGVSLTPQSTTAYVYDAFGNRTQMIEAQGRAEQRTTTYAYDADNRLVQQSGDRITVNRAVVVPTQTFVYDNRGNQIKATDADGATTYSYYDARDQKIAQVDALGHLTAWTYDGAGNVTSQTLYTNTVSGTPPLGGTPPSVVGYWADRVTTYGYDADNRQTSMTIANVESGSYNASTGMWTAQSWALTTTRAYDADGNVIRTMDANGHSSYAYYDKLGRKIAAVDAGGYLTTYTLDAEGNVVSQTQYATAVVGVPSTGGNPPSVAGNANDRTTTFTYDHDGQRLSETRGNAQVSTISGDSVSTATQSVTVTYTYNGLGQILQKTEATGNDATVYMYDSMGRLAYVTMGAYTSGAMSTQYSYDGLGNIVSTLAGFGTGTTETTSYSYGAGGRLATKTDATGFVTSYGYDAKGLTTVQSYGRQMSDGSSASEAVLTTYDLLGRVISTGKGAWNGAGWVEADTSDTYYDAFGEVIATGTNTGGNINKAQTFTDYDIAGRVWRTNTGDGVTKVYGYDGNGNQTVEVTSLGSTDLRNAISLDAALGVGGTSKAYSLYDNRGELIDVKRPVSANFDGTVASGGNAVIDTSGLVTIGVVYTYTQWGGNTTATVQVGLSTPGLTANNGTGNIHVVSTVDGYTSNQTGTFTSGSTSCGSYSYVFSNGTPGPGFGGPASHNVSIQVYQDNGSGGTIALGTTSFTVVCIPAGSSNPPNLTTQIPAGKALKATVPTATAVTMYVRPAGSSGTYTAVTAAQAYDVNHTAIPGEFFIDLTKPPFNNQAGTNWDVKYVAANASGQVIDAKDGTVSFDGNNPPNPTATSFAPVPVFTAWQNGDGSWTLTPNAAPAVAYSDSSQVFDAFGDVTSQTDANSNTTTYTYDVLGDMTRKIAPQVTSVSESGAASLINPTDTYYYDPSGRLVGHRDANGNLTTQVLLGGTGYDGSAALTTVQYNPDGGTIQTGYDIFGNVSTQTDAMGAVTTNTYDRDNRLIQVAHATRSSADSAYTWGPSQRIDAYVYDGLGERIKHINSITGPETTDYDLDGRIIKTVSFGGETTSYSYTWNAMTASGRMTAGEAGSGAWTTTTTNVAGVSASSTTDLFGSVVSSADFGGHTFSYSYNLGGELTNQTSSAGQSLTYVYTASGQIGSVTDAATGIEEVFGYDRNGNRTIEGYYRVGSTPGDYQNSVIRYDALNRVTEIDDANADITYSYDAVGNRREVKSVYTNVDRLGQITYISGGASGSTVTQDYWYKYDSMNRFVLTEGTLSGGVISTGTTGTAITYDARGDRMSATYGHDGHTETYAYSADGYLETVTIGGYVNVKRTTDVLGRMTGYTEYVSGSSTVLSTRAMTYDGDNRITNETDQTYNAGITYTSQITNNYRAYVSGSGTYSGADQGVITHAVTVQSQSNTSSQVTTNTNYYYTWWNAAKQSTVTVNGTDPSNPYASQWQPGNAAYTYDQNGNLTQVNDGGVGRVIKYQTDSFGQVLSRKETDSGIAGAYRNFFYLNGQTVGDVGDDQLSDTVDYAQQLSNDQYNAANAGNATYNLGATQVVRVNANFDENYQADNSSNVSQAGAGYTAMAGDTLQSVAQNVWGDSSLWYLLADANGLGAGTTLMAGQNLTIPDQVTNLHNASGVSKPYNAADALSNTTPTLPREPQPPAPSISSSSHGGCGAVGDILATIVAVVVAAVVAPYAIQAIASLTGTATTGAVATVAGGAIAGAAGGIASQATEIAVGNQSQFNWSGVAMAAIAGGVGGGLGTVMKGAGFTAGLERGLATSVISQGVDMATGLQKTFDWTNLAVAGVAGGVAQAVNDWAVVGTMPTGETVYNSTIGGPLATSLLSSAASALAGAATTSLLTGKDLGKSVMEALPGVIGSTIGDRIIGAIMQSVAAGAGSSQQPAEDASETEQGSNSIDFATIPAPYDGGFDPLPTLIRPDFSLRRTIGQYNYTAAAADGNGFVYIKAEAAKVAANSAGADGENDIYKVAGATPSVRFSAADGVSLVTDTHGGDDTNIYFHFVNNNTGETSADSPIITPYYGQSITQTVPGFGSLVLESPDKLDAPIQDLEAYQQGVQDSSIVTGQHDVALWNAGMKIFGDNWHQFTSHPFKYLGGAYTRTADAVEDTAKSGWGWLKTIPSAIASGASSVEHTVGTADGRLKAAQAAGSGLNDLKDMAVNVFDGVVAKGQQYLGEIEDGTWDEKWSYRAGHATPGAIETLALGGGPAVEKEIAGSAAEELTAAIEEEAGSTGGRSAFSQLERMDQGASALESGAGTSRMLPQFSMGRVAEGLSDIAERIDNSQIGKELPLAVRGLRGHVFGGGGLGGFKTYLGSALLGGFTSFGGYLLGNALTDPPGVKPDVRGSLVAFGSGFLGGLAAPLPMFRHPDAGPILTPILSGSLNVGQYWLTSKLEGQPTDGLGYFANGVTGVVGGVVAGRFVNHGRYDDSYPGLSDEKIAAAKHRNAAINLNSIITYGNFSRSTMGSAMSNIYIQTSPENSQYGEDN